MLRLLIRAKEGGGVVRNTFRKESIRENSIAGKCAMCFPV